MTKFIKVDEWPSGEVLEITLCHPPGNVLVSGMMEELGQVIGRERARPERKAIVIGATGKHFSYGAAVEEHTDQQVKGMLSLFHELIGEIIDCEVPTVSKVSGLCLGGGFEVALATTFLFADEAAEFALPEIELGVFAPVASAIASMLLPRAVAAELLLTGRRIGARELSTHGAITRVAAPGTLDQVVKDFIVERLTPKSASSLSIAYEAFRRDLSEHFHESIRELEGLYLKRLMITEDAREGIQAFLEKRRPSWRNA